MPVNTAYIDEVTVLSSVSLSGATLSAGTVRGNTLAAASGSTITPTSGLSAGNSSRWSMGSVSIIGGMEGLGSSTIRLPDGSALAPPYAYFSEVSLGFFRSAASRLALSYGQFQGGTGTAVLPGIALGSEASLGFYRSAASNIAVSYGTLDLRTQGVAFLPRLVTSANSTSLASGEFSVASVSVTSCLFVYRSGNTTFTVIATTGAVL